MKQRKELEDKIKDPTGWSLCERLYNIFDKMLFLVCTIYSEKDLYPKL
jgi:hypothetical protein